LNPSRVATILKKWGIERALVNSSADWGVSDPCSLPKVSEFMNGEGFTGKQVQQLLFENPRAFYGQSPRFKPQLDLPYVDPSVYQR